MSNDFDFQPAIPSIEEIPEPYRPFYEAKDDGSAVLADPLLRKRLDDTGLKTALDKERKANKAHEATLKRFRSFADDPDSLAAKLAELETQNADYQTQRDAKVRELETMLAQKDASVPDQLEKIKKELESGFKKRETELRNAIKDAEKRGDVFKGALHEKLIVSDATTALHAAQGQVKMLLPHVKESVRVVDDNGRFVARVVDADGDVRYNAKGEPMSISEFVAEMKLDPEFAYGFSSSGSSGSGAKPTGGGQGGIKPIKSYTLAEWRLAVSNAKPAERAQMIRDKEAGKILVK